MFIVLLIFKESKHWNIVFFSLWTFVLVMIAPINLLSMRHILKKSKPLERHGIYENVFLMRLYCLFWIMAVITYIAEFILYIYAYDDSLSEDSHLRCQIALEVMYITHYTILFGLDCLTLITFLRFSLKLNKHTM